MVARNITLVVIRVPNPCTQDWSAMTGDDQVRFCGVCQKSVYNLSGMTRHDAESLVAQREGRLCVRFYKREDGTVVTADCSALRKAARRVRRTLATVAATIVALITGTVTLRAARAEHCLVIPDGTSTTQPGRTIEAKGEMAVMGDMAGPPIMGRPAPPPAPPVTRHSSTVEL